MHGWEKLTVMKRETADTMAERDWTAEYNGKSGMWVVGREHGIGTLEVLGAGMTIDIAVSQALLAVSRPIQKEGEPK